MVLDGTMVIISCLALTIVHPGVGFGRVWQEANFSFRTRKVAQSGVMELESSGNGGSSGSESKVADIRVTDF